jgi:hypothetical protein
MPPQEGVNLKETFAQALHRCMEVECGLDLPADPTQLARYMHVRSYRFLGTIPLSKERQGERLVADDASGTALEVVKLKQKAYWMATVLLGNAADVVPKADGKEIIDLQWFSFEAARQRIATTNHPEKAELLLRLLQLCRQDLEGGPGPRPT